MDVIDDGWLRTRRLKDGSLEVWSRGWRLEIRALPVVPAVLAVAFLMASAPLLVRLIGTAVLMSVAFIAGRGGVLRDLLFALRYEADADGADHVTIAVPRGHPAADDLSACGYDFVNADDKAGVYGLKL